MHRLILGVGLIAATSLGATAPEDQPALTAQLESLKEVQQRWPGEKTYLDLEQTTFQQQFAAIARRFDIDPPDVILVNPPLDKNGKPKPQRAEAGIAWGATGHTYRDVIFITRYLKNALNDAELLAVLAHEMGHVSQAKNLGHDARLIHGKKIESEADAFALSCPEVDPVAFKSMVLKTDKLNDAAGRKHPLLYGDYSGSTAIVPVSVQTKLAFGGDHPTTAARIKRADDEISRRARLAQIPISNQ
jgi:Zn-dependent protease with chaperone function